MKMLIPELKYEPGTGRPYFNPCLSIPKQSFYKKKEIDTMYISEAYPIDINAFFELQDNETIEFEECGEFEYGEYVPRYRLVKYNTEVIPNEYYELEVEQYNSLMKILKKAKEMWEEGKTQKQNDPQYQLYLKLKKEFEGK